MQEYNNTITCFKKLLADRIHPAAQLAIYHQGRLVVNLAGNIPETPAIDTQTPFLTFSVTKTFTAMAILRLYEEGRLDIDAPIGAYWPEFAQRGKETATVRHALLHQAGVPAPHLYFQIVTWPFWSLVIHNLAREKALYSPGTQTAYHLVNFGFILGEVVRRITGIPIDRYVKITFFDPMGFKNTWMRIPSKALRRSPRLVTNNPAMHGVTRLFNLTVIRRALLPAAGLHSNALELATFFQMLLNDGEYQGKRYLKPESVSLATRSHYKGFDHYVKTDMNWGMGTIIGGNLNADSDPGASAMGYGNSAETFAAMGMGGVGMVWADRRADLVTAFTCNSMLAESDIGQRWSILSNAVWDDANRLS